MLTIVEAVVRVRVRAFHQIVLDRVPGLIQVRDVEPGTGLAMDIHDKVEEHLEYFEGVLDTFTSVHVAYDLKQPEHSEKF